MATIRHISYALLLFTSSSAFAATDVPFTVNMSEAVTVNTGGGTPRIAVDVGGVTRYASYASGTGTSTLTFTYAAQAGDLDLDGVTLTSPLDLNGGTITDLSGNAITDLTYTVPNTSGVKIDYPSLSMDFIYDADGRYTLNGTAYNDITSFLGAAGGTFTRASIGTYFDSSGMLQTAASGVPRFDHDPVTHAPKGILIEESRTNLFAYSDQFENAYWNKSGSFISPNAITAPDGTITADKLIGNNGQSGRKSLYKAISTTAGNKYTFSVYLKQAERNIATVWFDETYITEGAYYGSGATINLATGISSNPTLTQVTAVGNGWYRCTISATPSSTATVRFTIAIGGANGADYTGNGIDGIYAWGAQIEQGALATSYIPTTSAAVTRQGEDLKIPYGTNFLSTKGTWYAEAFYAPYTFRRIIGTNIADGYLTYGASGSALQSWDGVSNMQVTISPSASDSVYGKYALGWDNATMTRSLVANAGSLGSGGYTDGYQQTTYVRIGGAGGHALNSQVRKAKYYPARVSDTQLQLLTQ